VPELMRKTFLKATFGVLLSTSALFPLYAEETSEKTPTESQMTTSTTSDLPEITKSGPTQSFTLKNGLQVVVIENHRAPVVTQMIWYHVGMITPVTIKALLPIISKQLWSLKQTGWKIWF